MATPDAFPNFVDDLLLRQRSVTKEHPNIPNPAVLFEMLVAMMAVMAMPGTRWKSKSEIQARFTL